MNREVLRLALPNILSNVSVPLISSFDTALMGSLGGRHIAAVGLGGMAFNFVYWNFSFLRVGTTGLTAQAYGREDDAAQATVLGRGLVIGLIVAGLLLLLRHPLLDLTRWLLNVQTSEAGLVGEYFLIRVWAAPAALLQLVLLGWFFGRQNAVWPLVVTVAVNLINLALSYYLVVVKGWGIAGVAWGTVGAQYVGVVIAVIFALRLHLRPRTKGTQGWLAFFRINGDIFIRTLCLTLSFIFFYNRANAQDAGTAVVAANVILLQLVNWLSYGIDGFAYAAESLVGKYAGAGDRAALRRAVRLIFIWGMGLAVAYALLYYLGGGALVQLFAPAESAAATLDLARGYLPLLAVFCVLATPCYLLDGIFIGLVWTRAMRQTMILALIGYLALYYGIGRHFGNGGLWGALTGFMVLRGLLLGGWMWRRGRALGDRADALS